ncbi:MAG: hypothetical protein AVDCRST_MAG23-2480 [uncultured Sphingosinicella sp.]|uniref:Uncharacterized protein n=1 Tax=uncultured Sphingosinicella sp. TaxID=478748 RepID=A0A6J4UDC8_9SPHN|nr:hypothetical protein [uncultured Sphingosinicella sp.]CAA9545269.1 MAG: hypothetical protein AVDCRST_MAG23-2480 [uncultured Sphingosinicella sp.]
MNHEAALRKRLGSYWKIELSCAFLVPVAAVMRAPSSEWRESLALGAAILPVSVLLLIGGLYWRGVLKKAQGDRRSYKAVLRAADQAERPLIAAMIVGLITTVVALIFHGWTGPVIAALILVALAGLEFVNYYRIQLQNFDNIADLKRFAHTRRFRRSHLARDLEAFRRRPTI